MTFLWFWMATLDMKEPHKFHFSSKRSFHCDKLTINWFYLTLKGLDKQKTLVFKHHLSFSFSLPYKIVPKLVRNKFVPVRNLNFEKLKWNTKCMKTVLHIIWSLMTNVRLNNHFFVISWPRTLSMDILDYLRDFDKSRFQD